MSITHYHRGLREQEELEFGAAKAGWLVDTKIDQGLGIMYCVVCGHSIEVVKNLSKQGLHRIRTIEPAVTYVAS